MVARAPGRLDVMGGIADYSGSLVLQWPIREATLVAVQAVSEPGLKLLSLATENGHEARSLELNSSTTRQLLEGGYDAARRWFARDPALHGRPTCWAYCSFSSASEVFSSIAG